MILTWQERCEYWNDGEIVTNAKIQQVMQEEIDELRERLEETRQLYIKQIALQRLSDIGQAIEQRELTDEEIKLEAKYFCHTWFSERPEKLILFARAILKKTSEK
jgi:hypothetical protein